MTELFNIHDLECRLHSHCLEYDDRPLMNELLFLLDELQLIHGDLDRCDIPAEDASHQELTLTDRVKLLIREYRLLKTNREKLLEGKLVQSHLL